MVFIEHSGYGAKQMKVSTSIDSYLGEILLSRTTVKDT
jgi:hypothetical protein